MSSNNPPPENFKKATIYFYLNFDLWSLILRLIHSTITIIIYIYNWWVVCKEIQSYIDWRDDSSHISSMLLKLERTNPIDTSPFGSFAFFRNLQFMNVTMSIEVIESSNQMTPSAHLQRNLFLWISNYSNYSQL